MTSIRLVIELRDGKLHMAGNALADRGECYRLLAFANEFLIRDSINKVGGIVVNAGKPLIEGA